MVENATDKLVRNIYLCFVLPNKKQKLFVLIDA